MSKQLFKSILLLTGCFFIFLNTHAQNWEVKLLDGINPTNPISKYWDATSKTVYPIAVANPLSILAVGYIKKDKALQTKGWYAVGTLVVNTVFTLAIKETFNRQRPYEKYPTIIFPATLESGNSLPSGHTSTAFATATSLSINFKKWYVVLPAYAWATSVGYSRMYLGEHYPTDVFLGAIVGAGSAIIQNWVVKKITTTSKIKNTKSPM